MADSDNRLGNRASSAGLGTRGGDVLKRNEVLMIPNAVGGTVGGVSGGGG